MPFHLMKSKASSLFCLTLLAICYPQPVYPSSSSKDAVHFDIDASTGNKTEFALSAFIETNVNRADDGGLYAVCCGIDIFHSGYQLTEFCVIRSSVRSPWLYCQIVIEFSPSSEQSIPRSQFQFNCPVVMY